MDEGLLERFAAAQQWFPYHAPLALWGLWACFQTCASGNPHNKVTFVRSRALPACLDAMAQHLGVFMSYFLLPKISYSSLVCFGIMSPLRLRLHLILHSISDDEALQRQGLGLLFAVLMKPGQEHNHSNSELLVPCVCVNANFGKKLNPG